MTGATRPGNARWALSFADLCLLLLGFFVLLQARGGGAAAVTDGVRSALGGRPILGSLELPAARLFEPGEAVLSAEGRQAIAQAVRAHGQVRIDSRGRDSAQGRFDGWELAAARVAAVARAVRAEGVPENRIALVLPPIDAGSGPQMLRITPIR